MVLTRWLPGVPLLANSARQGHEDEHLEGDAYDAESEERGLACGDSTRRRSHYFSRDRCIAVAARHMTSVMAATTRRSIPPSTAPSISNQTPSKAMSTEPTYATRVKILSNPKEDSPFRPPKGGHLGTRLPCRSRRPRRRGENEQRNAGTSRRSMPAAWWVPAAGVDPDRPPP